ncbi:MAG TPA: dihydroxyacetone kinase subunit DhaK [Terriglobales bacterium]|nr:dihydroxyacetone kinase subunit DhaK [Terriglobales bacterium]
MKKLINDPFNVTVQSIEGFTLAYSHLVKLVSPHVVARRDAPVHDKVAVVVGGGSGHEPLFIGWVGYGMADAAVLGEVFSAPAPPMILDATRTANSGQGVLYVYGNYAGDNMNFDIAAEDATDNGVENATVRVWDDIASAPADKIQQRRGLAADFFVIKVAGAKAETGANLAEVKLSAEKARNNSRTFAVALTPATVPTSGQPTFTIGEREMYFGIGAHGERGTRKTDLLSADETAAILVEGVVEDLPFRNGDEVSMIVNGYGSTTLMELFIINRKAHELLAQLGMRIHRTEVGNFLTSQEMGGCSITLMRLDGELKESIDAPCNTPAYVHRQV